MDRKFGRIFVEDRRDTAFLLQPDYRAAAKIRYRDWSLGPIMDQGQTSQCVAYSGCAYLRAGPVSNEPPWPPEDLYRQCQLNDDIPGEDYDGSTVRGLFKVLRAQGFVKSYGWAFNVDAVVAHVLTKGPVVLGTLWYESMMTPDKNGFLSIGGNTLGGHAYLVYGVDLDKKCPGLFRRGLLKVANSWGVEWGQGGKAKLPLHLADRLIRDQGEACTSLEVKKD